MVQRKYTFADGKTLTLGEKTLVMGILNITPDSFYDGGQYVTTAVDKAHIPVFIRMDEDSKMQIFLSNK